MERVLTQQPILAMLDGNEAHALRRRGQGAQSRDVLRDHDFVVARMERDIFEAVSPISGMVFRA